MLGNDDDSILASFKSLLEPPQSHEFDAFDFMESEWIHGGHKHTGYGQYKIAHCNEEKRYRIKLYTRGDYGPEEYVVELAPFEITNREEKEYGSEEIEFDLGDEELMEIRETEEEAKDLALAIMQTIERGDWAKRSHAMSNLPHEYREPSY